MRIETFHREFSEHELRLSWTNFTEFQSIAHTYLYFRLPFVDDNRIVSRPVNLERHVFSLIPRFVVRVRQTVCERATLTVRLLDQQNIPQGI